MSGRLDSVVAQLESVVAELDEISFDQLREAVADGAKQRPASDKAMTQARRSVEKALYVLRRLDEGAEAGED